MNESECKNINEASLTDRLISGPPSNACKVRYTYHFQDFLESATACTSYMISYLSYSLVTTTYQTYLQCV